MKSCRNFSQRTHPIHPLDPCLMFSCISYYLGAFGRVCLGNNTVENGPTWCKSSCHEVTSEFFIMTAPDPPHWTINSCFGVHCTIWMHLGPFGCLTKLSAKRAEVVQKFVPGSRVLIFRNKHTRFDPLGPKLMFWYFHTIWIHLVPFGCLTKLGAKRAELVQKFVR